MVKGQKWGIKKYGEWGGGGGGHMHVLTIVFTFD